SGAAHAWEAGIARTHTARRLKFTLPGPMTIVDTVADAHYGDRCAMAMAFAELLNEEARELAAIGVDVIQFDEPAFNVYLDEVVEWGVGAVDRGTDRAGGPPRRAGAPVSVHQLRDGTARPQPRSPEARGACRRCGARP